MITIILAVFFGLLGLAAVTPVPLDDGDRVRPWPDARLRRLGACYVKEWDVAVEYEMEFCDQANPEDNNIYAKQHKPMPGSQILSVDKETIAEECLDAYDQGYPHGPVDCHTDWGVDSWEPCNAIYDIAKANCFKARVEQLFHAVYGVSPKDKALLAESQASRHIPRNIDSATSASQAAPPEYYGNPCYITPHRGSALQLPSRLCLTTIRDNAAVPSAARVRVLSFNAAVVHDTLCANTPNHIYCADDYYYQVSKMWSKPSGFGMPLSEHGEFSEAILRPEACTEVAAFVGAQRPPLKVEKHLIACMALSLPEEEQAELAERGLGARDTGGEGPDLDLAARESLTVPETYPNPDLSHDKAERRWLPRPEPTEPQRQSDLTYYVLQSGFPVPVPEPLSRHEANHPASHGSIHVQTVSINETALTNWCEESSRLSNGTTPTARRRTVQNCRFLYMEGITDDLRSPELRDRGNRIMAVHNELFEPTDCASLIRYLNNAGYPVDAALRDCGNEYYRKFFADVEAAHPNENIFSVPDPDEALPALADKDTSPPLNYDVDDFIAGCMPPPGTGPRPLLSNGSESNMTMEFSRAELQEDEDFYDLAKYCVRQWFRQFIGPSSEDYYRTTVLDNLWHIFDQTGRPEYHSREISKTPNTPDGLDLSADEQPGITLHGAASIHARTDAGADFPGDESTKLIILCMYEAFTDHNLHGKTLREIMRECEVKHDAQAKNVGSPNPASIAEKRSPQDLNSSGAAIVDGATTTDAQPGEAWTRPGEDDAGSITGQELLELITQNLGMFIKACTDAHALQDVDPDSVKPSRHEAGKKYEPLRPGEINVQQASARWAKWKSASRDCVAPSDAASIPALRRRSGPVSTTADGSDGLNSTESDKATTALGDKTEYIDRCMDQAAAFRSRADYPAIKSKMLRKYFDNPELVQYVCESRYRAQRLRHVAEQVEHDIETAGLRGPPHGVPNDTGSTSPDHVVAKRQDVELAMTVDGEHPELFDYEKCLKATNEHFKNSEQWVGAEAYCRARQWQANDMMDIHKPGSLVVEPDKHGWPYKA